MSPQPSSPPYSLVSGASSRADLPLCTKAQVRRRSGRPTEATDGVLYGSKRSLKTTGRQITASCYQPRYFPYPFNELLFRRGSPIFYAFDILYLNDRDLRQLPLIERKEKLRAVIEKSALPDVLCGKYIEGRGVDLFNEVVRRNLEGVVAKRKTGTYSVVSSWLKIKNPNYTQSERRYELFESFKPKEQKRELPPIPKKPLLRAVPLQRKKTAKHRAR